MSKKFHFSNKYDNLLVHLDFNGVKLPLITFIAVTEVATLFNSCNDFINNFSLKILSLMVEFGNSRIA